MKRNALFCLFVVMAFHCFGQYSESLEKRRNDSIRVDMELRYAIAAKGMEIIALNKKYVEREQQTEKENARKYEFFVFFILVIAGLFMTYNRHQLKLNNSYHLKLNQQQNELFTTIISVQDKERKRIAEDLHDGLGSILSTAKLTLARMEEENLSFTIAQKDKYINTLTLLDNAITDLRHIAHNIMPASLSNLGLIAAVKNLSEGISLHSNLQITFSAHDFHDRFDEIAELSIYRIILELVNNIVKHSEARNATVQLIKYPDHINIIVEDDGKGFNYKNEKNKKSGIGLTNISSRVEYLKGNIDIDSTSGQGTTVIIEVPLKEITTNG